MRLIESWFGKSRSERMELLLKQQLEANAILQAEMIKHTSELAKALAAQSTAFNGYMAAATISATPQVRPMDDWTEAALERGRKEQRLAEPEETLKALGLSGKDVEREMSAFMSDMRNDFGGMT